MRLLILCPRMPKLDGKADSMTVYRLARHFSQQHELMVLTFSEGVDDDESAKNLRALGVDVRSVGFNRIESMFRMAASLPSRLPLQTAYYDNRAMRSLVAQAGKSFCPDIVYAHLIRMAPYALQILGPARVLAMQISQTLNYSRMVRHVRSPFYRLLYTVELQKVRRYEPAIMEDFDTSLLISKHDLQAIDGVADPGKVFFSPHGVDAEYFQQNEAVNREPATLLFCGVLETPTNSDAVRYFAAEVYPLVKYQAPAAKFLIVGRNPPAEVRRLASADQSITVVPSVPDVRPFYDRAAIGVAPIRIGAGMQNKLLIGMSMQQAMVVTSVANEGISATAGEHLLVADTPTAFADAIVSLIRNPQRAVELGRRGRAFVDHGWSWTYWFNQLEQHMERLIRRTDKSGCSE